MSQDLRLQNEPRVEPKPVQTCLIYKNSILEFSSLKSMGKLPFPQVEQTETFP